MALNLQDALRSGIPIIRCDQPERQHVRRIETGIDVPRANEALEHQSRGGAHHQRQRDLAHDERTSGALARVPSAGAAGLVVQLGRQGAIGALQHRNQGEHQHRQDRDGRAESQHPAVDAK